MSKTDLVYLKHVQDAINQIGNYIDLPPLKIEVDQIIKDLES